MWLIFICSALAVAIVAMAVCWIGFKLWLKAKKEIMKFEKENEK